MNALSNAAGVVRSMIEAGLIKEPDPLKVFAQSIRPLHDRMMELHEPFPKADAKPVPPPK